MLIWFLYAVSCIILIPVALYLLFHAWLRWIMFRFARMGARQYAAARYEQLDEPPPGHPGWETKLREWEAHMQSLGFIRLLYYHNAYFASIGRPNFTCVYI